MDRAKNVPPKGSNKTKPFSGDFIALGGPKQSRVEAVDVKKPSAVPAKPTPAPVSVSGNFNSIL